MGLRFRKSIKLGKGVKLNLGKKSAGLSFGGKHGGISFNSKSGARARVSIPGTGISYTTKLGGSSKKKSTKKNSSISHSSAPVTTQVEVNAKTYWYLTLFLGWLGIHRFYRKDWKMGFLYMFTYGGLFIGWIYDIVVARKMIKELEENSSDTDIEETDYSQKN